MDLYSKKMEVTDKKTVENNGYTNYKVVSQYMGGTDFIDVPKDVYDNVQIGDTVQFELKWHWSKKRNRDVTYVTGLYLGK
ncbi:MAG: hypothetical protein J6S67_00080 [Methanobrevibacter sp.]|nr:hypothetical protein [Methanobrevibacter sp.]